MSKTAAGQKAKTGQVDSLKSAISQLDATLRGPMDGLELMLKQSREDLHRNEEDQEEISASRRSLLESHGNPMDPTGHFGDVMG